MQGLYTRESSGVRQLTEDNTHRITQEAIQYLAEANATNDSNGNQEANGTSTTTTATATVLAGVNPSHVKYNCLSEVEAHHPPHYTEVLQAQKVAKEKKQSVFVVHKPAITS